MKGEELKGTIAMGHGAKVAGRVPDAHEVVVTKVLMRGQIPWAISTVVEKQGMEGHSRKVAWFSGEHRTKTALLMFNLQTCDMH